MRNLSLPAKARCSRSWRCLPADSALPGTCILSGFLSQRKLHELYASAHLFLHPSEISPNQDQEGVPNSVLEAMATGLPVVATRHGGIPEAVDHGRTGFLVAEEDHVALANAMQLIVEFARPVAGNGSARARNGKGTVRPGNADRSLGIVLRGSDHNEWGR